MVFAALVGGLVGSRLVLHHRELRRVKDDLLGNIFSGSGLVWYGGAIGGAIAVVLWARWRRMLDLALLDICAPRRWRSATRSGGSAASSPATATTASRGTARGRWRTRTAPSRPTRRCTRRRSTRRSRWGWSPGCSGGFATASAPGVLFALYLICAGVERFLVEFMRRNDDVALGLTQAQLQSVVMMLAGVGLDRGGEESRRHQRSRRRPPSVRRAPRGRAGIG